ncbi:MAG: hypothetical protein IJW99_00930 [Clostridia bacterium]|nr:hypothetical protein [Clostridia bacterium]
MNNLKKMMIIALSALLCASMVACGNANDAESTTTAPANDVTTSATETTTEAPAEDKAAIVTPDVDANTPGGKMWDAFLAAKQENPEMGAEEMANKMLASGVIPQEIMMGAMALEANQEFFSGFGNYKITGYESGAIFMPMIGTTPIMGYIFELPEGADVDAFIKNLSENADLRWNVCTSADQMTVGAYETTVFFLMCPNSFAA